MWLLYKGNPDSAHHRQPSNQGFQGQPDPAREEEVAHPDPHGQEVGNHFANSDASTHVEFGEGFDDELNVLLAGPSDVHFDDDFTTDILSFVHLCMAMEWLVLLQIP